MLTCCLCRSNVAMTNFQLNNLVLSSFLSVLPYSISAELVIILNVTYGMN